MFFTYLSFRLIEKRVSMVQETAYRVRTPLFPLYSEVQVLLKIWPGVAKKAVLINPPPAYLTGYAE